MSLDVSHYHLLAYKSSPFWIAIKSPGARIICKNYSGRNTNRTVCKQLTSRIGALKIIARNADLKTQLSVANDLIQAKLTYLLPLFGAAPTYLMNTLQVQQLAAARVMPALNSQLRRFFRLWVGSVSSNYTSTRSWHSLTGWSPLVGPEDCMGS